MPPLFIPDNDILPGLAYGRPGFPFCSAIVSSGLTLTENSLSRILTFIPGWRRPELLGTPYPGFPDKEVKTKSPLGDFFLAARRGIEPLLPG